MGVVGAGKHLWWCVFIAAVLIFACAGPPATSPTTQPDRTTAIPAQSKGPSSVTSLPALAPLTPTATTASATSASPTTAPPSPTPHPPSPTPMTVAASTPVPATPTPTGQVSFAADVLPIFQDRCVRCHSGPQAPWQLQLTSHENVMKGSVQYKVIKPGDPAGSYLYQYVDIDFMPLGGPPLTMEQKETIRKWIEAGAPNN